MRSAKDLKNSVWRVKRAQSHRRHILTKKSTKRKRHLRDDLMISKADKYLLKECFRIGEIMARVKRGVVAHAKAKKF